MKKIFFSLLVAVCTFSAQSAYIYRKENVTIVRDTFGVPHIYGKADADAAYGLAWAHSEDAFKLIQYNLLSSKNMLGSVLGKNGVLIDYAIQFFGVDTLVENRYENDLSPEFRKVVEGYTQGVNDYASKHPEEVLVKNTFPFSPQDVIKGYVTLGILLAGAGMDLKAIKENLTTEFFQPNEKGSGSNAMVLAPSRTEDGKIWLLVNSHQPVEGQMAWYEAHINSSEGWNCLGGLFPGGVSVFVGCNEHLGWAHTTDYHNFGDVYKMKLSAGKKRYWYDGAWKDFSYKPVHLKIKLGAIRIPVRRKIPVCEYGPVFKTKQGWYALRYPSASDIRGAEEWFKMNKAANLEEFQQVLKMDALPLFNTTYGDKEGNIFFISDGKIPLRDSTLDWQRPVAGTSSRYRWTQLLSYERKIKYLNPECGFLFNCNGTPLQATAYDENSKDYFVGLQMFTYNRNERFSSLLNEHTGKFTWEDFKRIKFDLSYEPDGRYKRNFSALFTLDTSKYPELKDVIIKIKEWDLSGHSTDKNAGIAMLTNKFMNGRSKIPFAFLMIKEKPLSEEQVIDALSKAKNYLLKKFKTTDVELGHLQRLVRGNKSYPISGLSEVPRAVDTKYDKKLGIYKMTAGDGYMQFIKFGRENVEINTVSPFGASTHPDSKHYTDQMELFINGQTKKMSLRKEEVLNSAERSYHPWE
ncbi:MAG: penicillin acylase family protein [Sphingobacteriales bacterium]|nr:penicillin acylase family protein [Sphingobacteriales bacterium]